MAQVINRIAQRPEGFCELTTDHEMGLVGNIGWCEKCGMVISSNAFRLPSGIQETCLDDKHTFYECSRTLYGGGRVSKVVRWCTDCGSIRVDRMNGTQLLYPIIQPLKRPQFKCVTAGL
jgi:hypothetical protein